MTRQEFELTRVNAGVSADVANSEAWAIQTAGIAYEDAAHIVAAFDALSPLLCKMAREKV